jgi:uncharacterized membrane protein YcgQ (UPF0703/DUF1980 family)
MSGLMLISCEQKTEMATAQKFGDKVTLEKSVSLTEIYANPDQYKNKEIRVEGTIKEVCQHKGCWLKLTDGTKELTIRFKDYGFFVPKDAATSTVIVQGIFTIEPDMHIEQESEAQAEGKEHAEMQEEDEKTMKSAPFSFTASAVEIYSDSTPES